MSVVLAGCGDLGTEVALRFAGAGRRVLGLRRNPGRLPESLTGQAVDLTREQPNLPDGTEIVVIALTPDQRTAAGYRNTFLAGLGNVLAAVERKRNTPRVLFVSSTAVYGSGQGTAVDEDTATEPRTETGSVLVEAERTLHERCADAISLRLAGIYGPGRTSLIERVASGSAVIGAEPRYTNRIHRDDAAAAIVHLAMLDDPAPVYVGVDDEPAERAEILRFLADELGVAHPAVAADSADRGGNKRCRNDRLRATGFRFAYPTFREGYRAVLVTEDGRHP